MGKGTARMAVVQPQGCIKNLGLGFLWLACAFFQEVGAVSKNTESLKEEASKGFDYTPDRFSVPPSKSIALSGNLKDYFEFWYNRGAGSKDLEESFLDYLNPKNIQLISGFESFSKTRISLSTYEFRSVPILLAVEELLKLGVKVRIVSDPSTYKEFVPASEKQFKEWSPKQQQYYLQSFDRDRDGKVTSLDAKKINHDRYIAHEVWDRLKNYQKTYAGQVELVSPPYELVPPLDWLNYPRITHVKDYAVQFKKKNRWVSKKSMRISANLTDSCMSQRIAVAQENRQTYLEGRFDEVRPARGSQGNVQFGALIQGDPILAATESTLEEWIDLYKKKKHFDDVPAKEALLPRIVIESSRYRSIFQTFYSEGTKTALRGAIDPVSVPLHILSKPNVHLKKWYSSHFVSSHGSKLLNLRHQFYRNEMEDLFVVVDGNFATEPYSTLPLLTFAPGINNNPGVLPGKALSDFQNIPPELKWEQNVGVYKGGRGVYGADPDKNHSKVDYYEYLDGEGVRHYLLVWGSANSSRNAGRSNADALNILDSTDPWLAKQVKPFFEGLRKDSRIQPYPVAFLNRRFRESFLWKAEIFHEDFINEVSQYLSKEKVTKKDWDTWTDLLEQAKPRSAFGFNLLNILRWYGKYSHIKLNWTEFYILLELANSATPKQKGFLMDIQDRWLGPAPSNSEQKSWKKLISSLDVKPGKKFGMTPTMTRILAQCEYYLQRAGLGPVVEEGETE